MSSLDFVKAFLNANPDLIKVREYVARKHAEVNQTYDGLPYVDGHLDKVVATMLRYTCDITLIKAGYGHDLEEDTNATRKEIVQRLGQRSAQIVTLLTDGPGDTRFERQFMTYVNMRSDIEAVLVKICDRITNMSQSFGTKHAFTYINEHERFKGSLYSHNELTEAAWTDLESLYLRLRNHVNENQEDYVREASKK